MTVRAPREHDPRITVIQNELFDENRSKADKYRELFVGRPGLGALLAYEAAMILASWVPGALGLVLRSRMYPWILGSVGRNVELNDDQLGLIASDELNPQKARILLTLALLQPHTPEQLQQLFYTY